MKRTIFGIITFFLTFGISFSLVGLLFGFPEIGHSHSAHSHAARNIESVLDADMRIGDARRIAKSRLYFESKRVAQKGELSSMQKEKFVSRYGSIIGEYSDGLSAISTSHVPADFAYAWKKHVEAWNKEAKQSGVRGPSDSSSAETSEINTTWKQVIRIARRYGVHIKPRYMR